MQTIVARILGALLLLLPFFPYSAWFGQYVEAEEVLGPYQWFLILLIFSFITMIAALAIPVGFWRRLNQSWERLLLLNRTRFLISYFLLLICALVSVSVFVFQQRPVPVDSVVQLFQAKIFAQGALYAPVPAYPEFFATMAMVTDDNRWYGQYPPGHSLWLALGVLISQAWVIPILMSLATAFVTYLWLSEVYSERVARKSLCLLMCCPFFLFMGASFMNHVSTLFFVAVTVWMFGRWERAYQPRFLLLAGIALGFAFLSRPLCAVAIGACLALFGIRAILTRRDWQSAIASLIGFSFAAAFFFIFNKYTTGDYLLTGYIKLWGESHNLGFHVSPYGDLFTPWRSLGNQLFTLNLLNEFLFETPIPGLLPIAVLLLLGKRLTLWDRRLLILFFAVPAMYFFYWHRDSFLGPRYLYLGLLSLIPLTIRSLETIFSIVESKKLKLVASREPIPGSQILISALAMAFAYLIFLGLPLRFGMYASSLPSMKFDIIAEAQRQEISKGLIFIPVSWGTRIHAKLLAQDVPAAMAEQLYRTTDHCLLHHVIEQARTSGTRGSDLYPELEKLRGMEVVAVPLNNDRTLRLRQNLALTPQCTSEVRYDQQGYSVFMPHLADNDPWFNSEYVIAMDLGYPENEKLRAQLPGHPVYLYRSGGFVPYREP